MDEGPGTTDKLPADQSATPVWFRVGDAATRLGVVPKTVYRLIDKGELPGYRMVGSFGSRSPTFSRTKLPARSSPATWRTWWRADALARAFNGTFGDYPYGGRVNST